MPVDEVWGIGGASAAKLSRLGVQTAADLAAFNPDDARALMTVTCQLRKSTSFIFWNYLSY
ncbi:hypothetical protein [Acidipila sp. EB88]|uniref:hypothetical protein n=1 Tax=Acidipila sp. EB88 TaxID=2305226 RepID=UPI0035112A17